MRKKQLKLVNKSIKLELENSRRKLRSANGSHRFICQLQVKRTVCSLFVHSNRVDSELNSLVSLCSGCEIGGYPLNVRRIIFRELNSLERDREISMHKRITRRELAMLEIVNKNSKIFENFCTTQVSY